MRLIRTPRVYVAAIAIDALPASGGGGVARVVATVRNTGPDAVSYSPQLVLRSGSRVMVSADLPAAIFPAGRETMVAGELVCPDAEPWSPSQPRLYGLECRLLRGGVLHDSLSRRTGFRSIAASDGQILLNGSPVRLAGLNRHEDSPRLDQSADPAQARADLLHIRALGGNAVRLAHYPHDPATLDACDELGLLAIAEIPLYWWNGLGEPEPHADATLAAAERQLRTMVARDRHHPCVILWSVSNETQEHRDEVRRGNGQLVRLVRSLDPTRLVAHVSDKWWAHDLPFFADDDVCCVNGYPGLYHVRDGDPADIAEWWTKKLANLRLRNPGKPIVVTEFGNPAIDAAPGTAMGDDAQARTIRGGLAGMTDAAGAFIWCFADHPWPEEPFVNRMTTSPFGVVRRDRSEKQVCGAIRPAFLRFREG